MFLTVPADMVLSLLRVCLGLLGGIFCSQQERPRKRLEKTMQKLLHRRVVGKIRKGVLVVGTIVFLLFGCLCLLVFPIIYPKIEYYCCYCSGKQTGWRLFCWEFIPPSSGCLHGPNSQHSWAATTVYTFTMHYHTHFRVGCAKVKEISMYLDFYKMDYGQYPSTEEGLQMLKNIPQCSQFWESLITDPEGKPYSYQFTAGKYVIFSYGRDNKPGGHGRDADIIFANRR